MGRLVLLLLAFLPFQLLADCDQLQQWLAQGEIEKAYKNIQSTSKDQVDCPVIVGEIYLRVGRNDLAEEFFTLAMNQASDNSEEKAESLNKLGIVFWNGGSDQKARDFVFQSLRIRRDLYGESHEKTAGSYNDLGLVWTRINPDMALTHYEKALKIYRSVLGRKNEKVAQSLINTGIIYRTLELYGDAAVNFEEALNIWNEVYPQGHPNEGFIYANMGQTSVMINDMDNALKNFARAIEIYKSHYGEKHPEIANTYNLIGNIHNRNGDFEEALQNYQRALVHNSPDYSNQKLDSNPSIDQSLNANTLLSSLFFKSQALIDRYFNESLKFNDLKISLFTLQLCDSLIDNIRQLRTNESDKLALGRTASQVYETGVALGYSMADASAKKAQYYDISFYFAEKSKSAVLLEAISDTRAKSFAKIPAELLEKETTLKSNIAFYEQQIADQSEKLDKAELRNVLFGLKTEYENFIKTLEQDFPDYFNLKYNTTIPTIADLQIKLDDETAIYSYFLATNAERIFTFIITKEKYYVYNRKKNDLDKNLHALRNGIYFKYEPSVLASSFPLYEVLFPKEPPKGIQNLVIIPAGELGFLPFEALTTEKDKGVMHYEELPHLIEKYSISYEYAAALLYQRQAEPLSMKSNSIFLCAPVNFKYSGFSLPELSGTFVEVSRIESVMKNNQVKSTVLAYDEANEEFVKSEDLKSFDVLHFATHGQVNESKPELSKIYLSNSTLEDGSLFSGEIYNLDINANLVTLSACQTGLGKISNGEGIIGLSRALLFAGAKNIVVSLWTVSDQSTTELMVEFYKQMMENPSWTYSQHLRQAKLKMLKESNYREPYYWAPFVLVGI